MGWRPNQPTRAIKLISFLIEKPAYIYIRKKEIRVTLVPSQKGEAEKIRPNLRITRWGRYHCAQREVIPEINTGDSFAVILTIYLQFLLFAVRYGGKNRPYAAEHYVISGERHTNHEGFRSLFMYVSRNRWTPVLYACSQAHPLLWPTEASLYTHHCDWPSPTTSYYFFIVSDRLHDA